MFISFLINEYGVSEQLGHLTCNERIASHGQVRASDLYRRIASHGQV